MCGLVKEPYFAVQFTISIEMKWKDVWYSHKFWSDSYHCGGGGGGSGGGGMAVVVVVIGKKTPVDHSWFVIDDVFFSVIIIVAMNLSLCLRHGVWMQSFTHVRDIKYSYYSCGLWCFHSGVAEESSILGCYTMLLCKELPTF